MSTVAQAALIVAIGLLFLAAVACGVQLAQVWHARAQRLARLYLEPLSVWCLAAVVTHALALVASGTSAVLSLALPVGIGVAALLLRWADEPDLPTADKPDEQLAAEPASAVAPARTSSASLWSRPST